MESAHPSPTKVKLKEHVYDRKHKKNKSISEGNVTIEFNPNHPQDLETDKKSGLENIEDNS